MKRASIALAVIAAAWTASLFGGGDPTPARATTTGDAAVLSRLLNGLADNETALYVRRLERRLEASPTDPNALVLLGFAYQQRARETGDARYFTLSERAFRRTETTPSVAALAKTGLASLAVSRHRFAAAVPLARGALRADPENATALGALGDALLNVGRYRAAFAAYDRMAELSPSVASYARIAHARELLGRPRAAAEALELALTLDVPVQEHRAAALVQLGNVAFNVGDLALARRRYEAALAAFPGYVHAQAGLARARAAAGDLRHAIPLFRRVVARLPLPQYAIWQAESLRAAGRHAEARRAYALVSAIEQVQAANGVRTDLQTALFDVDRGRRLREALARARAAEQRAPNVDADDVLAWALARNGRCAEALHFSRRALRLGTRDAAKFFHRGMVDRCLGDRTGAKTWFRRALALNPHFSLLWGPVAQRYAR